MIENPTIRKVFSGEGKVSVYGVGYVGLALIAAYLRKGLHVIGMDIDEGKLEALRKGEVSTSEVEIREAVKAGLSEGRFEVTADGVKASRESVVKVITVPVWIDWETKELSFSAIRDVGRKIGEGLKEGDLVILESSVPVGTTNKVLRPVLEEVSGLKAEEDFYLAYSPERVYIGRAVKDIEVNYPKVIGGVGPQSLKAATEFYKEIAAKGVIQLSNPEAAEFEKLAEGVYRDVNIALANELALAAMEIGVDFFEAREAANSQPYSHIHLPGPGVGGYCIPTYPYFLMKSLEEKGFSMDLTRLGRRINESMPLVVVKLIEEGRQRLGIPLKDAKVAVLGIAFRGNIDDTRLSPALDVVGLLKARGYADIIVHDPYVRKEARLESMNVPLTHDLEEALKGRNIVVVTARHRQYVGMKATQILEMCGGEAAIIDTVNAVTDDTASRNIISLGRPLKP